MPYTQIPPDHGEFSGGPGLIDPERRKDRVIGQEAGPLVQGLNEELMEIYATWPGGLGQLGEGEVAPGSTEPAEAELGKAPR